MNEDIIEFEIGHVDQVIMNRKARRTAQIQRGFNTDRNIVEKVHKAKVRYNRNQKHKVSYLNELED